MKFRTHTQWVCIAGLTFFCACADDEISPATMPEPMTFIRDMSIPAMPPATAGTMSAEESAAGGGQTIRPTAGDTAEGAVPFGGASLDEAGSSELAAGGSVDETSTTTNDMSNQNVPANDGGQSANATGPPTAGMPSSGGENEDDGEPSLGGEPSAAGEVAPNGDMMAGGEPAMGGEPAPGGIVADNCICRPTQRQCQNDTAYQLCVPRALGDERCGRWSEPILCPVDQQCAAGRCFEGPVECMDECRAETVACLDNNTKHKCGQFDDDPCLEWGRPLDCEGDERCIAGTCVPNDGPLPAAGSCDAPIIGRVGLQLGATIGASRLEGRCGGGNGSESVIAFTAPADGRYRFSTEGSTFDTVLYGRLACDDPNTELDCAADAPSVMSIQLNAGQTLYIIVDSQGENGEYVLNIADEDDAPAEGGTCESPFIARLGANAGETRPGSNHRAVMCGGDAGEAVYQFTPPEPGVYSFDTMGTRFESVLYTRPNCNGPDMCGEPVEGNALSSEMFLILPFIAPFYFFVDGVDVNDVGEYQFNIERIGDYVSAVEAQTCASARDITLGEHSINIDPVSQYEGSCTVARGAGNRGEAVLRFQAPFTGDFSIIGISTETTPVIYLRDDDCEGGNERVCAATLRPPGNEPTLTIVNGPLIAGQVIYIFLDGATGVEPNRIDLIILGLEL